MQQSTYEIFRWVNTTLQGQFRKYPSVIRQVARLSLEGTISTEEAKERFYSVNLAVARLLATGAQQHRAEEIEDSPEVLAYAKKLTNYIDLSKPDKLQKVKR